MTRVVVTGGAGALGGLVVDRLAAAGHGVRGMSRRRRPSDLPPAIEWTSADLATGEGLAAAVAGVDVIVHAASNPIRQTARGDAGHGTPAGGGARGRRRPSHLHLDRRHRPGAVRLLPAEAGRRGGRAAGSAACRCPAGPPPAFAPAS